MAMYIHTYVVVPYFIACLFAYIYCSQTVARDIYEDLVQEYTFSSDQVLELSGFHSAVAITKVSLLQTSVNEVRLRGI